MVDFDKKGKGKLMDYLPKQNAQRIQQVNTALNIKTGWGASPGVTLSFTNGSLTFTITPTGDSFEYWIGGIKYIKTSADTVTITDTEGIWFIYYVGTVLTASQTVWSIKAGDKAFVSIVYWDATNNKEIGIAYELHSYLMNPSTHDYLHYTVGTNFESGFALVEGTGAHDGKVALDSGVVWDEDIEVEIDDGAGSGLWEQELGNTSVFAPAQIPVYYRSSASAWRKYTTTDYPFYDNGAVDNVHYNSYSAPNWSSTAASSSAKYIAMWIFATNNISEPVITIMGQNESNTLNAAKEINLLENLSLGTLFFKEYKILYRLIFKSDSTHAHTEDMRSVSNIPGGTYVPQPSEVSDEAYSSTWNGITTIAPSKNAVYDMVINDINLNDLNEKSYNSLTDKPTINNKDFNFHLLGHHGANGFNKESYYGPCYKVASSDASAEVVYSYYIKEPGSYSIQILYATSATGTGVASGLIYAGNYVPPATMSWNKIGGVNCDLSLGTADRQYRKTYGNVDLVANSYLGLNWYKDAVCNGTNLRIYGIIIVKN